MQRVSSNVGTCYFNPRSLAGATVIIFNFKAAMQFQSTLPRGSDESPARRKPGYYYFNPRSLAGATQAVPIALIKEVFQSTLPRGSDLAEPSRL